MSVLTNSLNNINRANAVLGGRNARHHLFPLKDLGDGPNEI